MKQVRQTYLEMIIAIALQAVVICIAGAFITKQYIMFPVSVLLGCAVAVGVLAHMMRSITAIVELNPQAAKRYGAKQAVVRTVIMGVALCLSVYYSEYVNPWGVLIGIATLKFSAYLQIVVHKVFVKIEDMKGRKER